MTRPSGRGSDQGFQHRFGHLHEIRSRYPHDSEAQRVVRFRRAIENSTDADVLEIFCSGDGDGDYMTDYPRRNPEQIRQAVSGLQDEGVRRRIALDMAAAAEAEKQKQRCSSTAASPKRVRSGPSQEARPLPL